MKNTWNGNLITLLREAGSGKPKPLKAILKEYAPFAVANADYTHLLLLRHFEVREWEGQRSVLNCAPEADGNFQWGITIVNASNNGSGSQSNVYLPNTHTYTGLQIAGIQMEIGIAGKPPVETNVPELHRKLKSWGKCTEADIEADFQTLCNEQYDVKLPVKPFVENKVITLAGGAKLIYNKEQDWYEGSLENDKGPIKIIVCNTAPEDFKKLLLVIEAQFASGFLQNMLLAMEPEMRKLKNETWIGEDEDTGKEEEPVTAEAFRHRISVDSIIFNNDFSVSIYCNDGDLFWGHGIEISVDKEGNYKGASLIG